jgi:hypothetical protein
MLTHRLALDWAPGPSGRSFDISTQCHGKPTPLLRQLQRDQFRFAAHSLQAQVALAHG